jgi:acetoin utilization deacetylase AcuC-like enzyme
MVQDRRRSILLVDDPIYLEHAPPGYHPERPERLGAAQRALLGVPAQFQRVPTRPVTEAEAARVHAEPYVRELFGSEGLTRLVDPDTYLAPRSVEVARAAAGTTTDMVESIARAQGPDAIRLGLSLVRPPGHHARRERAMGFCLLNNIAIAARAAQAAGLPKIAIIDFDVHHGNGTQEIFYDDPSVLYVSTHQFPFYPGTGSLPERGRGDGEGHTINVPLSAGADDAVFAAAFRRVVLPALHDFAPSMVLVSAGFDAAAEDPLAEMELTPSAYAWMTHELRKVADAHAEGRMGLVLEGGYDLPALERCLHAALLGALGEVAPLATDDTTLDIRAAVKAHAHWKGVG